MKRKNIRTLSFLIVTLTYLIIGAAFFDYLESDTEKHQNAALNANITKFMKRHGMNESEFDRLWNTILWKQPYEAGNQWKFMGSLYFCTLVVTLIGYGHSTPRTGYGKCFCIVYTIFGIPIFLIMFQSVGERLNSFIVFLLSNVKKWFKFKKTDVSRVELIAVEMGLTMTLTVFACYIFVQYEKWSYTDAFYYCFITLTTIGFGDFVPLQKDNALSEKFSYACFTIFFIITGLTTLASSMNLLVLRLASLTAEEQVQEKIELDEAIRQMAHLDGDIISYHNKMNSFIRDAPEKVDTISVCTCNCVEYEICPSRPTKCFRFDRRQRSSKSNLNDIYFASNYKRETENGI